MGVLLSFFFFLKEICANTPFFLLPNQENGVIFFFVGLVAQLVEPPAHNRIVVGSKPAESTKHFNRIGH